MFDGISRDGHSPLLTRIDLRERPGGLAPAAPIEFGVGYQSPDLSVGEAFCVGTRTSLFPKMVDRPWPTTFWKRADADSSIENVLPKCLNAGSIGHQSPEPDHCNRLKRALIDTIARFSVFGCQRHLFHLNS
jgi:hypothetical protein